MQNLIARFYAPRAIFACRLHTKQHRATIRNNNFSTCWAHDGVITRKQKKIWASLFPELKNSTIKSTIDPSYKWINLLLRAREIELNDSTHVSNAHIFLSLTGKRLMMHGHGLLSDGNSTWRRNDSCFLVSAKQHDLATHLWPV